MDNDGDALVTGALYFNSTTNIMNVRTSGGAWTAAGSSVNGTSDRNTYTATSGQTTFSATYDSGYVDVYLNGVKLVSGTDFTATNGTSVVLASGATVGDIVDIVAYGTFTLSDHYTKTQSDDRYLQLSGGTLTGGLTGTTATFSGDLTVDTSTLKVDSSNNRVGVGTASPSSLIHASGAAASDGAVEIRLEDTAASSNSRLMRTGSAYSYAGVGANETWLYHAGAGTINVGPDGAGTVKIVNNGSERMRIDSSGNVLVGTTSTSLATTSSETGAMITDGSFQAAANNPVAQFNRITTDGAIVNFRKDGTTVGSIGVKSSRPYFSNNTNCGIRLANNALVATDETGTNETSVTDLGATDVKWKDAYLSGTVNAGGATIDGTLDIEEVIEKAAINTTTSGLFQAELKERAVVFLTANQTANRQINFRGDGSNSLNSMLAIGQSITMAVLATQGSTAYYLNNYSIDGNAVTPKWQGGTAPTAGNASGIDAYSFTIIKTADATFTVLASVTQFA